MNDKVHCAMLFVCRLKKNALVGRTNPEYRIARSTCQGLRPRLIVLNQIPFFRPSFLMTNFRTIRRAFFSLLFAVPLIACGGTDNSAIDGGETSTDSATGGDAATGGNSQAGTGGDDSSNTGGDSSVSTGGSDSLPMGGTDPGLESCGALALPSSVFDTANRLSDGAYHAQSRFSGQATLSGSCVTGAVQSALVQLSIPEDGSYELVASPVNGEGNMTALSLLTDCDTSMEIACESGNHSQYGESRIFIMDARAGESRVALIELIEGNSSAWHLTLRPIKSTSDIGEDCSADEPCLGKMSCTEQSCVADTAPVIASLEVVQSSFFNWLVTVTGTDPNRNVSGLRMPLIRVQAGGAWGDSTDEDALVVDDFEITWAGDDFTLSYVQTESVSLLPGSSISQAEYEVLDRAGNVSNVKTLSYPGRLPTAIQNAAGDSCDFCNSLSGSVQNCGNTNAGFPAACNANGSPRLQCAFTSTEGAMECAAKSANQAPILGSVAMSWQGLTPALTITGSDDSPGRFFGTIDLLFEDNNNGQDDESLSVPVNWLGTITSLTWSPAGTFSSTPQEFNLSELERSVVSASLSVRDNVFPSSLTSQPFSFDWVPTPLSLLAVEDGECDGVVVTCASGLSCSPDLAGDYFCAPAEAPVLYGAMGFLERGLFADIDASDANADWASLVVQSPDLFSTQSVPVEKDGVVSWSPHPLGSSDYLGRTTVVSFSPLWLYQIWLEDKAGLFSNRKVISSLSFDLSVDDVCEIPDCSGFSGCILPASGSYCDVPANQTCSGDPNGVSELTCQINTPPVIDSMVVHRIDKDTFVVDVTGSDVDYDARRVEALLTSEGITSAVFLPVAGGSTFLDTKEFSFSSAETNNIAAGKEWTDLTIEVTVLDRSFSPSNAVTMNVPPLIAQGQSCTSDDTIGICDPPLTCQSNICEP